MTIINRDQTEPFTTADGSTIREIQNQSLAEAILAPGQSTVAHFHPRAEEIYFILTGSGTMTIDDATRKVRVGDAIAIPSGQIHQILNDGETELRFLCCCAPAYSHDDTILVAETN
ncbi:MAG TPA: cupin domain-containing protein [Abditibacterium sp.]|jgi:mannose-6-phosphate isomerase-like protein (cupin superfamily)